MAVDGLHAPKPIHAAGYLPGMPTWIAKYAAPWIWRKVPWKTVWTVTLWLAEKGRDRVQNNLSTDEQSEFWGLVKKSRGRPSNLDSRDRDRIKSMAGKAIRG
jgi:hypothetical protein